MLLVSSLCCWLCVRVDAVNLASSLALTEGMLAAHLLPFTLFMALQIKTTFTHTLSPALPTALLTLPLTLLHLLAAELRQVHPNIPPPLTILLFQQPESILCCFLLASVSPCIRILCHFACGKSHHLNPFLSSPIFYFYYSVIPHTHHHLFLCVLKFSSTIL